MTPEAARRATGRPRRETRRDSRHGAREAAIQMLYQWEVGRIPIDEVAKAFWTQAPQCESLEEAAVNAGTSAEEDATEEAGADAGETAVVDDVRPPVALRDFATELAGGVASEVGALDPIIAEAAEHWRLERMTIIDRLILRLAVYEFLRQPATPARVVINEALELARTYSTDDAVRFINGILDGIRRSMERA